MRYLPLLLLLTGCAANHDLCKESMPNPNTKEGMAAILQEDTDDLKREMDPNSVPPRKYYCKGITREW